MKFRVTTPNGDLIKGDCKLKIGDTDIDLKEFDMLGDGKTSNCYLLTSPGDILTPHLAISLTHQAEEFVDVVVDGILRASSGVKKGGKAKNFTNHVTFDKVLSYTFKGNKRKALMASQMVVQTRDASKVVDVDVDEDLPTSSVGTIEFQLWRKYPEANPFTMNDSSEISTVGKRATPISEEYARWFDLNCRVSKEPMLPSFEIGFTGEPKLGKTLKDKIKEERPGFNLYHTVKFHLVSGTDLRELGFEDVPLHFLNTPQTTSEELHERIEPQESYNISDAENDDTCDDSIPEAANDSSEYQKPSISKTLLKQPPHIKTIKSLLEDLPKAAEKEKSLKGKTSAKSEGSQDLKAPSSSQISATPKKQKSKVALVAEEVNELLNRLGKYKHSSSTPKGTPSKETSTKKKKATVLPGVKGAPAHTLWLEREATQSQESLPKMAPPLTQSSTLSMAVSFPNSSLTQDFDAAISELARQKRPTSTESKTPTKHCLAKGVENSHSHPDGAALVPIIEELQASPLPDSQLSTQSCNTTQERVEVEESKVRNDENMIVGQVRESLTEQSTPMFTRSTSSDAPTEVVVEMPLTPEEVPGTPETAGGCTSPITFTTFSLPSSIENLDGEQNSVIGLDLSIAHTTSNRYLNSTSCRTLLPSARPQNSVISPPFDSTPPFASMTQGTDLRSSPRRLSNNLTCTQLMTPEQSKQKSSASSACSALMTLDSRSPQEGTPTKASKSVRFTASTKSAFTSTTNNRIFDPFVLSPLLTPEKRKLDINYNTPRKLSTSPSLKNCDIAQRAADAQARIAAARRKREELEKEARVAETFAAEREKVRLLEEEATTLEQENDECQAKIKAIYGGELSI
ncbi:hypothetical protein BGZ60DRAFT_563742 [Tricladium varicosporioides]|nr:hypothetical protein BGZ60DRAFT_563742 [Hymenoscyphus varicosporioides]